MAIIAVDPKGKIKFVPKSEKEEENPTVFYYLPMAETEKVDMATQVSPDENGNVKMPKRFMAQLAFDKLVDWENFNDSAGNPVPFTRKNFDRLPWLTIVDIATEILNTSGMGEAERKN